MNLHKPRIKARLFGRAPFEPRRLGMTLAVPLFLGTGATDGARRVRTDFHAEPIGRSVHPLSTHPPIHPSIHPFIHPSSSSAYTHTSLQYFTCIVCPPPASSIGSATLQLAGRKRWTLVPSDQSYRLRPSLAPDGRAFFCTRRAHGAGGVDALAAAGATHYEVEQRPGDVLWVPTWTWHRVDYLPNVTALSVSLFHLRAEQLAAAQPLLTAAMVPSLFKELVGWKTQ